MGELPTRCERSRSWQFTHLGRTDLPAFYIYEISGGRCVRRRDAGVTKTYFFSVLAGTLTEAESFVISSNRFCASAISEGCVATWR